MKKIEIYLKVRKKIHFGNRNLLTRLEAETIAGKRYLKRKKLVVQNGRVKMVE